MSTNFDNSANFAYTGTTQVWSKPINVYSIFCRVNGGGGGGSLASSGGGGAYVFTKYNFLDKDVSYNVFVNVGSGGKKPPIKTGGKSLGGQGSQVNGGDGTTLENLNSGGGGGMSSLFYQDGSGNNTIQIIAGGGGGGGGNVGNGGNSSRIGLSGGGIGGGQGGNQDSIGDGGLGGEFGGVNGFNYIDSSNVDLTDISNNGIYSFIGGGGGNGGTFAGGGGGSGYGGGAGGKGGGGGGGGSISNGQTIYFVPGAGGAGGGINESGTDGSIEIGWFEEIPEIPQPIVSMFMLNTQHTSRSIYAAPSILPLSENVTTTTTGSLTYPYPHSIVIDQDEEIYFISGDGYLYKYDHNFNFIWRYKINNYNFIGTPAITNDGTIYACTTTNTGLYSPYVYAIVEEISGLDSIAQGSIKWRVGLDGNCVGSPMLDVSSNIYIGTTNGSVYKIVDNLVRGITLWRTPTTPLGYPITGTLAIDADYETLIYTANNSTTNTSYMYSIDISNNTSSPPETLWTKSITNDTYNSPSIRDNGDVYATTPKGKVYSYNRFTGINTWSTPSIDVYDGSLSNIAIGNDDFIYFTSKYGLNVVNSSTGTREWKYTIEISNNNLSNSTPTIDSNNNVYFGTNSHYIYCVNGVTRTHLWKYELGGPVQSSPIICNHNDIKVLANDGKLYDISGNGNAVVPTTPQVQMFMLDERHTGKSPYSAPATQPTIKWTSNFVSGNLYVLPTVAINSDGTSLYLGSNDGYLYSLNTSNGVQNWKTKVSNPDYSRPVTSRASLYTSPAISSDGTIYVGSNDGYLHAVHSSGDAKWTYNAGYPLQSSPIIDISGAIYFGAGKKMYSIGDNGFYAYSKWVEPFDTSGNINSSPVLGQNGTIYFGSDDGKVYGINRKTGKYIWDYNANITSPAGINPIYTSPSVDSSNNVIIGNGSYMNGELYYLDGSNNDGSKIWSSKYNTTNTNIGPFYNTVAINETNDTLYLSTIAYVYAIDRTSPTGAEKWIFRKANCYYTSPVVDANGKILFCSINARTSYGYLHMITDIGNDYTEDWIIKLSDTDKGRLSPPVIGSDGKIYISSTANKIYAVGI